ncbi:MAG: ATP synthase F0 subunit B [Oscillospiraceae bacterium]|nr:ATP synthase F0 subunit B [Oscillospiraceae bacterium]
MTIEPSVLIWTIINFIVLMVVLNLILYKPLFKFMDERRERINQGINAGRRARAAISDNAQRLKDDLEQFHRSEKRRSDATIASLLKQRDQELAEAGRRAEARRDAELKKLDKESGELTDVLVVGIPGMIELLSQKLDTDYSKYRDMDPESIIRKRPAKTTGLVRESRERGEKGRGFHTEEMLKASRERRYSKLEREARSSDEFTVEDVKNLRRQEEQLTDSLSAALPDMVSLIADKFGDECERMRQMPEPVFGSGSVKEDESVQPEQRADVFEALEESIKKARAKRYSKMSDSVGDSELGSKEIERLMDEEDELSDAMKSGVSDMVYALLEKLSEDYELSRDFGLQE